MFITNVYLVIIIVIVFSIVDPTNGTLCSHTIRFGSMGSVDGSQLKIMLNARQINLFN